MTRRTKGPLESGYNVEPGVCAVVRTWWTARKERLCEVGWTTTTRGKLRSLYGGYIYGPRGVNEVGQWEWRLRLTETKACHLKLGDDCATLA